MLQKTIVAMMILGSFAFPQKSQAIECNDNQQALVKMVEELNAQCKAGDKDACEAYDMLDPEMKKIVCDK